MPPALGRILSLVRKLIDFGKQIATTVKQRAASADFSLLASSFGSADLAVILARITNGLRGAMALETALCQRAVRGQDLTQSPSRMPATRAHHAQRQVAPPAAQPEPDPTQDPRLARLPTEQEIAAEACHRA
jgi:hypothetical protein